ncbi:MAG: hypothetical protein GF365_00410 [Candidatus Buchananbacteria bacterium]|nr:hypothetical protein [Candidatus Buchananbacteria bacterium]
MATAFNCKTPKDGWSLYSHFLGNCLVSISFQVNSKNEQNNDEAQKEKSERIISDSWLKLIGALYMIKDRIENFGHSEEALKMQQIIDMVVNSDLTDLSTHDAILVKQKELES